jgi:hypothetical protein
MACRKRRKEVLHLIGFLVLSFTSAGSYRPEPTPRSQGYTQNMKSRVMAHGGREEWIESKLAEDHGG